MNPGSRPPPAPLELYSMEACPSCRRVRNTLTELGIDFLHRSCPKGETHNRTRLQRLGGRMQLPYLVDPNCGVSLYEASEIIDHLVTRYGGRA